MPTPNLALDLPTTDPDSRTAGPSWAQKFLGAFTAIDTAWAGLYKNGTKLGIGASSFVPAAQAHVKAAAPEILRLETTGHGWLTLYDGATVRGYLGYGSAGQLLSLALTNSFAVRAEAALHFGNGSTVVYTQREIGYTPGTGYIGVGGDQAPLSVLQVGGETSPELSIASNTTGQRWSLQSNGNLDMFILDRQNNRDRMRFGHEQNVNDSTTIDIENGSGTLMVTDASGSNPGLFLVRKSIGITEVSDPNNAFSTVKDTATSVNVYWDSGASAMRIQNKTGSQRKLQWTWIGTSAG